MQAFEVQCSAVRQALTGVEDEAVVEKHVQSLVHMLVRISPVDKARLLSLVGALPDSQARSNLVSRIETLQEGGSSNSQDWTSLHRYVTNPKVQEFCETKHDEAKAFKLLNYLWLLGLRNPSEKTFQVICALYLYITQNINCSEIDKKTALDKLKLDWRQRAGPGAIVWIGNLPAKPHLLDGLVPESWFLACFGVPTAREVDWIANLDDTQFSTVVKSIPMRKSKIGIRMHFQQNAIPSAQNEIRATPPAAIEQNIPAIVAALMGMASPHQPAAPAVMALAGRSGAPPALMQSASFDALPSVALGDGSTLSGPGPTNANAPAAAQENHHTSTAGDVMCPHMSLQESTQALVDHAAGLKNPKAKAKAKAKMASKPKGKAKAKAKMVSAAKGKAKAKTTAKAGAKATAKAGAKARAKAGSKDKRSKGCSKCRGKPGCTPSCRAHNTQPY